MNKELYKTSSLYRSAADAAIDIIISLQKNDTIMLDENNAHFRPCDLIEFSFEWLCEYHLLLHKIVVNAAHRSVGNIYLLDKEQSND